VSRIPQKMDGISQPKEFLVSLVRSSRRKRLRKEIIPLPGATSKVGTGYNARLGEFVRKRWNPRLAASVSVSLKRTLARLRNTDVG
jgi:hypothetical protein